MVPVRESTVHELNVAELDEVSGGLFDFGNAVVQPNISLQLGINILSLGDITQGVGQGNFSFI